MKQSFKEYVNEQSNVFDDALDKESDRAIGIIAVCHLDNLLEKLIRAHYVKDPQVKSLFKNDHILQTFFAKVNIAYFSGLIPKFVFHDLKLIGEIRNRFAHQVVAELGFADEGIAHRISSCVLRPKTLNNGKLYGGDINKIRFIIIVTQIGVLLIVLEYMLSKAKVPKLMDIFNLDEMPYEQWALSRSELISILAEHSASSEGS